MSFQVSLKSIKSLGIQGLLGIPKRWEARPLNIVLTQKTEEQVTEFLEAY